MKSIHHSTSSPSRSFAAGYTVPEMSHPSSGSHAAGHRFKISRGAGGEALGSVESKAGSGKGGRVTVLLNPMSWMRAVSVAARP